MTEEQLDGRLFHSAEGGTLLLDEIGALPMPAQLQAVAGSAGQSGSSAERQRVQSPVNVRIISTTNHDLQSLLSSGQFRDDLYYRLNVVHIELPPLSRRREDIPVLVAHFLAEISKQTGQRKIYAPEAIELLATSEWPGNVRQLDNVVRQNCALAQTPIIPVELVQQSLGGTQAKLPSFDEARDEFTRSYLSQILQITGGNVSQAARLAKRNRTDFYKLLGRHHARRMISKTNKPPGAPQFRKALGAFATGVTIVTTRAGDQDIGLTANSFNSVSLDPPMVLWSLARNSLSLPAFLAGDHFAVHVLSVAQEPLSKLFAVRGENKFKDLPTTRGHGDVPLLSNCAARFQCRTAYRYEGGDHMIFVGEVLDFDQTELAPLVFHGGRYAIAAAKSAEALAQVDNASGFSNDFLIYLLSRAHHQLFLQMRRELLQHGMGEAEWFCLSILSTEGILTLAELGKRLADTGIEISYDRLAGLAAADFLSLRGGYDPSAAAELTHKGRKAVIELIAAAKIAETSIESQLGPDETRVLKQWLRGVSADHKATAPAIQSAHTELW